jgi:hypothetical protein
LNFACIQARLPGFGQALDQFGYSLPEVAFNFLVHTSKELSHWSIEKYFISKDSLEIWSLPKSLVPADTSATS